VNHLITAAITEQVGDFAALMAHDGPGILGVVGREPARHLVAGEVDDDHGIAALEPAFDLHDTGGQQAAACLERVQRAGIDGDGAGGLQRAAEPALARGLRLGLG
jgi:hypothetical protein